MRGSATLTDLLPKNTERVGLPATVCTQWRVRRNPPCSRRISWLFGSHCVWILSRVACCCCLATQSWRRRRRPRRLVETRGGVAVNERALIESMSMTPSPLLSTWIPPSIAACGKQIYPFSFSHRRWLFIVVRWLRVFFSRAQSSQESESASLSLASKATVFLQVVGLLNVCMMKITGKTSGNELRVGRHNYCTGCEKTLPRALGSLFLLSNGFLLQYCSVFYAHLSFLGPVGVHLTSTEMVDS